MEPSTCGDQRYILEYLHENCKRPGFDQAPYDAHIMKLRNEACSILLNTLVDGSEAIARVFYSWFQWDQLIYIRHTWGVYKNDPLVVKLARQGAEDSYVNDGEVNQKLIDEFIRGDGHVPTPLISGQPGVKSHDNLQTQSNALSRDDTITELKRQVEYWKSECFQARRDLDESAKASSW